MEKSAFLCLGGLRSPQPSDAPAPETDVELGLLQKALFADTRARRPQSRLRCCVRPFSALQSRLRQGTPN